MSIEQTTIFPRTPAAIKSKEDEWDPMGNIFRPSTNQSPTSRLHFSEGAKQEDMSEDPPLQDMAYYEAEGHASPIVHSAPASSFPEATGPWVTVFGFKEGQVHDVLQALQAYGSIVDFKRSSGNWVHVQFDSALTAQHCLAASRYMRVGGNMIGVVPLDRSDEMTSRAQPVKHSGFVDGGLKQSSSIWDHVRGVLFG
ncbi:Nup53/35/40-type RNA recognition motif [Carpediemonas membranifera]|uniref:Nup53/35/40-type RNA recognition motif n=1 Tax=Carpediemonas membranifera TaxID=201153 RepID=A0A8J6BCC6_9EUKA|nr:Nup53/35/40-type RNA recognition motif [Carpediemonas membranifera]|eukprot:KAG9397277.1 Nup53/35/40-type RNA recognition motif [Carpediemonas membranifera]